ncbi:MULTISPECIES: hypothetical protein [Erythrobacteraceae]|uniref:Transcriptional regulator n=1 Tax=Tsuneonella litorea TaxID=2976475 RepID=A0A9X2W2F5_9SPHN|nr:MULTISPECIES: hypothetical protein [Erythrobacteraceae]MCT2559333.1 hypothetical protein [Tsuneonella litorea]MDR7103861.1 pyruvate,orthophosphate dikinase [Croceicoccus sp. BE223]
MLYTDHLVLHGIGIKKYADAVNISEIIGIAQAEVENSIDRAEERGLVMRADGKATLGPAGRLIMQCNYSRFYDSVRKNDAFVAAYDRFEELNVDLKSLITAWQVRDIAGSTVRNDHTDADYDNKIIDRLGALHESAERILAAMASVLPRMAIYREKLLTALERAEDGAIEWVSDAKIESYHTLWFELHEDLLCMLGKEREE